MPPQDAEAAAAAWRERLGEDVPVLVTSSATHEGIDELALELLRRVPVTAARPLDDLVAAEALAEHQVFRPAAGREWHVESVGEGAYRSSATRSSGCSSRYDVENEEALAHVERRLKRMGVIRALEAAGFEPGDDVEIAGVVFELDPG